MELVFGQFSRTSNWDERLILFAFSHFLHNVSKFRRERNKSIIGSVVAVVMHGSDILGKIPKVVQEGP